MNGDKASTILYETFERSLGFDRPIQSVHVQVDVSRYLNPLGQRRDKGLTAITRALGRTTSLPFLVIPSGEFPRVLRGPAPLLHQAGQFEDRGCSCGVVVGAL